MVQREGPCRFCRADHDDSIERQRSHHELHLLQSSPKEDIFGLEASEADPLQRPEQLHQVH